MQDQIKHLILIDSRQDWVNWAKIHLLSDDTEAKLLREMEQLGMQANDSNESQLELENESILDESVLENFNDLDQTAPDEILLAPPLEEIPASPSVLEGSDSRKAAFFSNSDMYRIALARSGQQPNYSHQARWQMS